MDTREFLKRYSLKISSGAHDPRDPADPNCRVCVQEARALADHLTDLERRGRLPGDAWWLDAWTDEPGSCWMDLRPVNDAGLPDALTQRLPELVDLLALVRASIPMSGVSAFNALLARHFFRAFLEHGVCSRPVAGEVERLLAQDVLDEHVLEVFEQRLAEVESPGSRLFDLIYAAAWMLAGDTYSDLLGDTVNVLPSELEAAVLGDVLNAWIQESKRVLDAFRVSYR